MNTLEKLTKDMIDEAKIHFVRGLELLDRAEKSLDAHICAQVDKYMALPYNVIVEKSGKLYAGRVKELKNVEEYGNTYDEAYDNIIRAMRYYFKFAIENNEDIPTP